MASPLDKRIAQALSLSPTQVGAALSLLDDGNTVPFLARYRKEHTGGLDEVQLRDVQHQAAQIRALESRREAVLASILEQGKLTDRLRQAIVAAESLALIEDLYAPFRPRRTTRATRASEAGLDPVAEGLLDDVPDIKSLARRHRTDGYDTEEDVLAGARDILAERLANNAEVRATLREAMGKHGRLTAKKRRGADDALVATFKTYVDFTHLVSRVRPHQVLALRRGEADKALSVGVSMDDDRQRDGIRRRFNGARVRFNRDQLDAAIDDGYKRLLFPAIERDVRGQLEEQADAHAIGVFEVNLQNLLMQPPVAGRIMGIDPGLRTGCKIAIIDETGRLATTSHIYVVNDKNNRAVGELVSLLEKHQIDVVAIGNGTGSRETEAAVVAALERHGGSAKYLVVDEAGASIYSASDIAREEFPDLDVSVRGAVSIARRLQDPLAELVKIDPQAIGVGMYQHDVNQTQLAARLDAVVENVVNNVGVDLNRASRPLLARVAGIGPTTAGRIVAHRDAHGAFVSRKALLDVKGLGAKTYEQCAGFLRVANGKDPLDNTGIHPERYRFARTLLKEVGLEPGDGRLEARLQSLRSTGGLDRLATAHDVGAATLADIVDGLLQPGRDPRATLDAPILRTDAVSLSDLHEGMRMTGTVRNVVDFGAFVDIGVKQAGLVHVSEMADHYVKDPYSVVSVGQRVQVVVVSIDEKRGRIGLSMKR